MKCKFLFCGIFWAIFAVSAAAAVRLPRLISDGVILQRDQPLKLWGWADPGEAVSLRFNNKQYETLADGAGNWQLLLPPQKAGGPFEFTITASNEISVSDIYFGDVWLCSGQSNMELTMSRLKEKYPEEIQNCQNHLIRQFEVPDVYDFNNPHVDLGAGQWQSLTPQTALHFSAIAFFFAKEIYAKTGVPIGLINSALGGSPIECWMSEGALKQFPSAYAELQQFKNGDYIRQIESADQSRERQWYAEMNAKDVGLSANPGDWQVMTVPGYWTEAQLGAKNGVVWFKKQINVPKNMVGKPTKLWLGAIIDQDSTYVNGKLVGEVTYKYPPRIYYLDKDILHEGINELIIRLISKIEAGGFMPDKPYLLTTDTDTIDLSGDWKFHLGAAMPPLEPPTFIRWKAGGLFNAMIHPLINFKIKGALWYQGESNTGRPAGYADAMGAMIADWRRHWGQGDFPFLYVQLANFQASKPMPEESGWAELRQEQLNSLRYDNTGMAVAIDIGEWNDIHPLDKKTVAHRLALLARKKVYGEKSLSAESPQPQKVAFKKDKVVIKFRHVGQGLVSKDGQSIRHFALSADGKNFQWADAVIKKNKVYVKSRNLQRPIAVRYAWADNPERVNLYGKNGLPITPFEFED
ncbi:MAG: sialate O-acetylesterase [Saprospiraceae bacterium]|jgi:sialate O-acetylesterase|nr:sialate O-acetylesterase [Saprospiraceae bacterium]